MNNKKLLMMVEIAIFAAIGLVLDQFSFKLWAQGGSISLAMVPIVLIAFRWGTVPGLVTGFLVGALQAMFGGYILTPLQGFIDYFFAYTAVGLAGIIRNQLLSASKEGKRNQMVAYMTLGTLVGGLARYIAHTVAGVVFFAEYAGKQNVYLYSIIYNGSYMIPDIILTIIVAALLFTTAPKLLEHK